MKRWLLVAVAACAHRAPAPLPVAAVASFDHVTADQLVEQGDVTYILGPDGLVIARGDRADTVVPMHGEHWTSAASIAALDGEGRWIVATRADGTLWRIRLDGALEAMGGRFGLSDREPVHQIAAAGKTIVLALDHGIAITRDGVHLSRYAGVTGELAVASDRVAISTPTGLELWDLAASTRRSFRVTGRPLFVGAQLVVVGKGGLWLERAGTLERLPIKSWVDAAVAGAKLWVTSTQQLYVLSGDTLVATAATGFVAGRAFGAPSGDVWIDEPTGLRRFSLELSRVDPTWRAQVQPIFERVCAHCHLPGGSADVDLSTPGAWRAERGEIVQRVFVTRTMPPAGTELTDAARAALDAWLRKR